MLAQTKQVWLKLCEQAANEQDPEKFSAIVHAIDTILELKTGRLRKAGPQRVTTRYGVIRCSVCHNPVANHHETGKSSTNQSRS